MGETARSRSSLRFTEVDVSPNDGSSWDEYSTEQLVSLENSLQSLSTSIGRLDESAAIYLYTMEWEERPSDSLYYKLNNTLRRGNRSEKKRWSLYLKLLVTGLKKLPSIEVNVWRILKADVSEDYSKDKSFAWPSVPSCSRDLKETFRTFWDRHGQNTLFNMDVISGKDISAYSEHVREAEIVLLPGTRFRVTARSVLPKVEDFHDVPVIHLQEI